MSELPRHIVVALVYICKDDAMLLVKQNYGPEYWSLPGGVVELGESIEEAAIREAGEETGLQVRIKRVVGLYSKPGEGSLAVTFEAEVMGGTLDPACNDVSDCRYFPLDALPEHAREHLRQRVDDYRRRLPYAVIRAQ
jgi:8-oxo-dGTP diphosphatase